MYKYTHLPAPFEVKFVAETGQFEGYASVFDVTDSVNDRVMRGAFQKSLNAWRDKGAMPPMLWQHDTKQPIGAWREISEDSHGLFVSGELFVDDITKAREAHKLMRESVVTGLSIGYQVKQSYRDAESGERILSELDLLEISMVTFPANQHARVSRVKSLLSAGQIPSQRDLEAFLRQSGFSRKQSKALIAGGYKSMQFSPRDAAKPRDAGLRSMDTDDAAVRSLTALIHSLV